MPGITTSVSGGQMVEGLRRDLVNMGYTADEADSIIAEQGQMGSNGKYVDTSGNVLNSTQVKLAAEAQMKSRKNAEANAETARTKAQRDKWEAAYAGDITASREAIDTQQTGADTEFDFANEFARQTRDFWSQYATEFTPFFDEMQTQLSTEMGQRRQVVEGAMQALGDPTGTSHAATAMQDAARRAEARWKGRAQDLTRLGIDPTSGRYQGQERAFRNEAVQTEVMAMNDARRQGREQYLESAGTLLPQLTGETYTNAANAMNKVWMDRSTRQSADMAAVASAYHAASGSQGSVAQSRLGLADQTGATFGIYEGQTMGRSTSGINTGNSSAVTGGISWA